MWKKWIKRIQTPEHYAKYLLFSLPWGNLLVWAEEDTHRNIIKYFLSWNGTKLSWKHSKYIRIKCNSTVTILYTNNMGETVSDTYNKITKTISVFCKEEKVWVSTKHIPISRNIAPNFMSRTFSDNTEWQVFLNLLKVVVSLFEFCPEFDLLVFHIKKQTGRSILWHPPFTVLHLSNFQYDKQVTFQCDQEEITRNFHFAMAVNMKCVSSHDLGPRRLSDKNTNNIESLSLTERSKLSFRIPGYGRLFRQPLISRCIKESFNWHSPLPRYLNVQDINTVLFW